MIREVIQGEKELSESFERMNEHLGANRIELDREPLTFGAMLTMDPETERFVGRFSGRANRLAPPEYREPFVIPDEV